MNNTLQGKRILLADDHAMVRLGFRMLLEGAGASVVAEADNGESAVRMYAECNPDVVVMDASVPVVICANAPSRTNSCRRWGRWPMIAVTSTQHWPSRWRWLSFQARPARLMR